MANPGDAGSVLLNRPLDEFLPVGRRRKRVDYRDTGATAACTGQDLGRLPTTDKRACGDQIDFQPRRDEPTEPTDHAGEPLRAPWREPAAVVVDAWPGLLGYGVANNKEVCGKQGHPRILMATVRRRKRSVQARRQTASHATPEASTAAAASPRQRFASPG